MANKFTQIYIQIVFSVKNRDCGIPKSKKEELHKYITGIVENKKCKLIAINSMPDHIHIFIGLKPIVCVSDLVKDIKLASNEMIRKNNWSSSKFEWQDGFGAFSYSKSQIDSVCKYILNQEEHHKKITFRDEYLDFLNKFGIEYKPEYVFDID